MPSLRELALQKEKERLEQEENKKYDFFEVEENDKDEEEIRTFDFGLYKKESLQKTYLKKANFNSTPSDPESFLYIIEEENSNFIKIGISTNIANRLNSLQTGNPRNLEIIRTYKGLSEYEGSFHNFFHPLKYNGEWFDITKLGKLNFLNLCDTITSLLKKIKELEDKINDSKKEDSRIIEE